MYYYFFKLKKMNCNEGQVEYKKTKVYDKSEIFIIFESFQILFYGLKSEPKVNKKKVFIFNIVIKIQKPFFQF